MKAIDAVSKAFNLYTENPMKMAIGGLVTGLLIGVSSFLLFDLPNGIINFLARIFVKDIATLGLIMLIGGVALVILGLVQIALSGIFAGGAINFFHEIIKKKDPAPMSIAKPKRAVSLALAPFVSGIPTAIILSISVLVVLLVAGGLSISSLSSGQINTNQIMTAIGSSLLVGVFVFFVAFLLVFVINLLLSFMTFSIVLDGKGVINAAITSAQFVIHNIVEVIFFLIVMIAISVGLVIVSMIIFGLPLVILSFIGFILNSIPTVGPLLGSIYIGLLNIATAAVFSAIFMPFILTSNILFYLSLREQPLVSSNKPMSA